MKLASLNKASPRRKASTRRTKPEGCYIGKEDAFQRSAISLVRALAHPYGVDPRAIMHVPNGGQRNAIVAAKLKAHGVVAGYPDIMVFHPEALLALSRREGFGDRKAGLAIELKVWPNKPSDEQLAVHRILESSGWRVVVCYGLGDVENAVTEYLR